MLASGYRFEELSGALLKRLNRRSSSLVVERGALSTEVLPPLKEGRCPGMAGLATHGQASAVLVLTPHWSGLSGEKPSKTNGAVEWW